VLVIDFELDFVMTLFGRYCHTIETSIEA